MNEQKDKSEPDKYKPDKYCNCVKCLEGNTDKVTQEKFDEWKEGFGKGSVDMKLRIIEIINDEDIWFHNDEDKELVKAIFKMKKEKIISKINML